VDAAEARCLLQQLDRQEQLSLDALQRLFKVSQLECPPSCHSKGSKGNKDNPNCVHGLVPAENSFRKKGLWQKETLINQLGRDPADDKRKVCPLMQQNFVELPMQYPSQRNMHAAAAACIEP